ncbi:MAG: ATPase, T2SS/T4P/T4SS family [Clostridia bacterium]|nr:ATPase, T2SS/T4P/T4SS family [Clostridia bacterium]
MISDYSEIIEKCLENVDQSDQLLIEQAVTEYIYSENNRDIYNKEEMIENILDSIIGYGFIQPLMTRKGITEIMINSDKIFFEEKGRLYRYNKNFTSQDVERLINILCRKTDRTVNMSCPILDGSIGHDIRVNIVLSPIANNGNSITIRRFPQTPITDEDMVNEGFFDKEIRDFLSYAVKNRYNIFICGGAGCGKTTLLNVMSTFIPKDERVITIEDSVELMMNKIDNVIRLVCRNPNSEGKGKIDIGDLIKSSLRMRPDRIIVGEVRGGETLYMLQAMNTGHIGSISTGHANSCKDAFSRLETMVLMECDMPLLSIRKQICNALDIIICLGRINGKRTVLEISEVLGFEGNEAELNMLYTYDFNEKCHEKVNSIIRTEKMDRGMYNEI